MKTILIVEDDENLGKGLHSLLTHEGYEVHLAKNLAEAKKQFKLLNPCLLVLDWMLPDGQGIDFLRDLRFQGASVPVILLTARAEVIDKVLGLEMGASDYLTKPFDPRELLARVRARLREAQGSSNKELVSKSLDLVAGPIRMDLEARSVQLNGATVEMAKMEFDLLRVFLESPNKVFSREELLNQVWGYQNFPTTRTVDTHILQLRQKLGEAFFETLRGVGYRFKI